MYQIIHISIYSKNIKSLEDAASQNDGIYYSKYQKLKKRFTKNQKIHRHENFDELCTARLQPKVDKVVGFFKICKTCFRISWKFWMVKTISLFAHHKELYLVLQTFKVSKSVLQKPKNSSSWKFAKSLLSRCSNNLFV